MSRFTSGTAAEQVRSRETRYSFKLKSHFVQMVMASTLGHSTVFLSVSVTSPSGRSTGQRALGLAAVMVTTRVAYHSIVGVLQCCAITINGTLSPACLVIALVINVISLVIMKTRCV